MDESAVESSIVGAVASAMCRSRCLKIEGAVGFEVPQLEIDIDKVLPILEIKFARNLPTSFTS